MQVLFLCLMLLVVENVQLVRNEQLGTQEVLDSTQFKNAVAKELLKKKLSALESTRQHNSLGPFLRKGGKNLSSLRTAPKSSFHKEDDPSRKQAQMANTFIASSNLLFGTKSQQRKACKTGGKPSNKEVLDMRSLRQTCSGYNEDGSDFSASKEASKPASNILNSLSSALRKRSNSNKANQDPISCYLTEPQKVTCMHKDIIYKIALPSSEVADDEIGRIVESIYRSVEGKSKGKSSLEEPIESAPNQKTSLKGSAEEIGKKTLSDDSLKKKRASDDYLRSLFLNNLLTANQKTLPNYGSNNPMFIPLLIPLTQPKLEPPKAQAGYYTGLAIEPRLQIPMNLSLGVDPLSNYQNGRNMIENGYGQYLASDRFALPELNLKARSQVNLTAEEEKRRNWLALMATNGLVSVGNGVNPNVLTQHSVNGEVQSIDEEKDSQGNKLTVAETGEVLDKLLNKRQQRDTYFLKRPLRRKPIFEEKPTLTSFGDERRHMLTKVVQKLSGDNILEEKKRRPGQFPCSSGSCASSKDPKKPTKCAPKHPSTVNLLFPNSQSSDCTEDCTTAPPCTTKCSTTEICSTCPKGCEPVTTTCSTTCCLPCSKKADTCRDPDILSRAVSGGKRSDKIKENEPNVPPLQARVQNWIAYSPQLVPRNQQFARHSDQSRKLEYESLKDPDHPQPNFASETGVKLQYSTVLNPKPVVQSLEPLKNDYHQPKPHERFDNPGMPMERYFGPFHQQYQPQQPTQENLVRNQIQVNYKLPPSLPAANTYGSAQTVTAAHDMGSRMNAVQNESNLLVDHNNTASKQNETKNKKHQSSFFARLRSKFHKGIPMNGTEQDDQRNPQNQQIQNRPLLGKSIFRFSPKNQTLGIGRNSSTTARRPMENVNCLVDQNNQSNDQTLVMANQTQPSTINNINITITSIHPQPGAQGQVQTNNQTNQPQQPSKNNPWLQRNPSTGRAASSRTCKATKIWLCSQQSQANVTCTEPSKSQTNQTTASAASSCRTTQTTCSVTQSTCATTKPTTCSTSRPTTQPTCSDWWSSNPNQTLDGFGTADNMTASTCEEETPSTPTCSSEPPPGCLPPQTENPWSPGNPQLPPGIPGPPPDTSQGSPGAKMKSFLNYGPVWSQWQYPMDRVNFPEQNLNWQQQTWVPYPTPYPLVPYKKPTELGAVRGPLSTQQYLPQAPQQTLTESGPKMSPQIPSTQGPYLPQAKNPLLPLPPKRQPVWGHPSSDRHGTMWQAPSQQVALDPKWQNIQPNYLLGGVPSEIRMRPVQAEFLHQPMMNPNEGNMWRKLNYTMNENARDVRKVQLPANIKQHIARVRRYLLKKRSKINH